MKIVNSIRNPGEPPARVGRREQRSCLNGTFSRRRRTAGALGRSKASTGLRWAVKFMRESTFWYFLAHRALERSFGVLGRVLASLDHRANELSLPIHYPHQHATAWAVLLQLFAIASPYRESAGRFGFEMMLAGFDHVFAPKDFSKVVLERSLGNLQSPALPGRTHDETIVDTFLANGMKLTNEEAVDPGNDRLILQSCLTDRIMFGLGREAVRPPVTLWQETTAEYESRRPGFFRRQFSDPNKWLFN